MEAQEARLYKNNEIVEQLCLIGDNDEIDEIIANENGTMTIRVYRDVYDKKRRTYENVCVTFDGITKISFK